jgi:hypothetical protein
MSARFKVGDNVRVRRNGGPADGELTVTLITGQLTSYREGEAGAVRGVYPSGQPGHTHFTLAPFTYADRSVVTWLEAVNP